MRFAEEIVADRFVPTWRSLLARALVERGMSQTEVALAVGISQSAVSKQLQGKFAFDATLAAEPRVREAVERVAAGIADGSLSPFQALAEAEALVRELEDRGPICRLHEEEMPALAGLGCDICVCHSTTTLLPEQQALSDLRAAIRILETTTGLAALVPYVGTNVARAVAGATDVSQVAAVPGRLFVLRGAVKVPAAPEFGVSHHMAEVLLRVAGADPSLVACLNLTPDPALFQAARGAGLRVERVPPDFERAPGTLAFTAGVPDVFYHEGAFGIEPQAYLVASSATLLAQRLRGLLSGATSP